MESPKTGSTFWFTPERSGQQAARKRARCGENVRPGEVLQILMVEDDDDHRRLPRGESRTAASKSGFTAFPTARRRWIMCSSGGPAPALSPRPHMILLDLRLPAIDGIEVLRTIKEAPELRTIPAIMLTTSDAERDIASADENDANSYLAKSTESRHINDLTEALGACWPS